MTKIFNYVFKAKQTNFISLLFYLNSCIYIFKVLLRFILDLD